LTIGAATRFYREASLSSAVGNPEANMRRNVHATALLTITLRFIVVGCLANLGAAVPAAAEVVRFEINGREPFADGRPFGNPGAYERIIGKVHFAVDPKLRQNQAIVDLNLAPKNATGKVEFASDLFILAPVELEKSNGAVLYDVNNRGNKLALGFFNERGGNDPKTAADAGDGFLMRQGFIIVWSGWNGELLPGNDRMHLYPPVAKDNGRPIVGMVRCEIVPNSDAKRIDVNWANHGSYRPTAKGLKSATLTWRLRPGDPRVSIPREQWTLHVTDVPSASPNQLPRVELEAPAGLRKAYIYELIYEAQDPLVHGVCFASVRDLIAAFRYGGGQDNPLVRSGRPVAKRAIGFGVSQSGRFLREFLYWGFNEDEEGRKVFDGVMPHVSGAGLGSFNHRFAQPTRHVNQHDHHDYPADRFPFAYETQTDPLSGCTDGILERASQTNTTPIVLHTQSAGEYWTRSGSLVHTDPQGARDSKLPDNVRIYAFGGTQHGPANYPPSKGDGQNLANPGDYRPLLRALLAALAKHGREGTELPKSVYPRISDGTLVDWRGPSTRFPSIPNVRYPEVIQQPPLLDFGPRWSDQWIIDVQPPRIQGEYTVLVPKCGSDGNELGCLLPPEVAVPLGTHTGWNLRSREAGAENELVSLGGSYIPFPVTKKERETLGDPRPSLEERYGNAEVYGSAVRRYCAHLQKHGYLLEEDVERIVSRLEARLPPSWGRGRAAARVEQRTTTSQSDQKWGQLRGRGIWAGAAIPPKRTVTVARDPEFMIARGPIYHETIVVDPESKGVKNIFVYLVKPRALHPDYPQTAQEVAKSDEVRFALMNGYGWHELAGKLGAGAARLADVRAPRMLELNRGVFVPHAFAVREGERLLVKNGDPVTYNIKATSVSGRNDVNSYFSPHAFQVFEWRADSRPIRIEDVIYSWMAAGAMVFDHPYFAVTAREGAFEIRNVPIGENQIAVRNWNGLYLIRDRTIDVSSQGSVHLETRWAGQAAAEMRIDVSR
jgi:hypothetical protein